MNNSQMHLHSENFDLCRICLLEPESNRHVKFIHIFSPNSNGVQIDQLILDFFAIKVDKDDVKPKIICDSCFKSLLNWTEMKKKATEAQVVIKYIETKRFGPSENLDKSRHEIESSTSRNCKLTNVSSSYTNSQKVKHSSQSIAYESDDDLSCEEVLVGNEVICISDSEEESIDNSSKIGKLRYCSICKRNRYNHDCYKYNKEFSTCLVPNCNILSRSLKDLLPHYQLHIGMPLGVKLTSCCYQERKTSEYDDSNGHHTNCRKLNVFKCYMCTLTFDNMAEFANHKFKKHNGHLINAKGNYLCFYCEKSTQDLIQINEHIKYCCTNEKNQDNSTDYIMAQEQQPIANNKTTFFPFKKIAKKGVTVHKRIKGRKVPRSSKHILFTCLKRSCNLIFQSFSVFKYHHREHFGIGNQLMCWQCCIPFTNLNYLRLHQVKGDCRTPGMFKCYECTEEYNDLQSLSIHKYTIHNGDLICNNRKNILCAFCKTVIGINNFKNHLLKCQTQQPISIVSKRKKPSPVLIQKPKCTSFECSVCHKVCLTAAALSSHRKVHNHNSSKNLKNNLNTSLENNSMASTSDNQVTDIEMNLTLSSSLQNNETSNSVDEDMSTLDDNWFSCINCQKKFRSKKGLEKHWTCCSNMNHNSERSGIPHNYYCTECKEYYTRISFGDHWKTKHGKRLAYSKYRRYSCSKCSYKFVYKIALIMHEKHEHSEPEKCLNTTNNEIVNDLLKLPVVSDVKPLAMDIDGEFMETNVNNYIGVVENTESPNIVSCEQLPIKLEYNVNELDDSRNNEEQNLGNNNDEDISRDDDNGICLSDVQNINQTGIEMITEEHFHSVDNVNEMIKENSKITKYEINEEESIISDFEGNDKEKELLLTLKNNENNIQNISTFKNDTEKNITFGIMKQDNGNDLNETQNSNTVNVNEINLVQDPSIACEGN